MTGVQPVLQDLISQRNALANQYEGNIIRPISGPGSQVEHDPYPCKGKSF